MKRTLPLNLSILFLLVIIFFSCSVKKHAALFNRSSTYSFVSTKSEPKPVEPENISVSTSADIAPLSTSPTQVNIQKKVSVATGHKKVKNTNYNSIKERSKQTTEVSKSDLENKNSKPKKVHRTVFLNILLVIIAVILPPLAVLFVDGLRGPFWLSILLTLLFYVPGLIYALIRIFKPRVV